ncbi:hypothetical protein QJS10_CPB14g00407 [Acorus calamus]|uniref:Uncharacterized protein n=1 Tax=Acorus calamus TaxID=4465 RepID=A0AAV9DAH1_ACOCL|nr:hypothetical protein QJS10_CPB14g00407 [Acorus calamus]
MDPNLSPTTTKPETPPATTKTSPFVKQYSLTWATFITCFLLYINLAYLINGSGVVAFIIAANPVLALLSCCIQWHEKAPEGSEQQMRTESRFGCLGLLLVRVSHTTRLLSCLSRWGRFCGVWRVLALSDRFISSSFCLPKGGVILMRDLRSLCLWKNQRKNLRPHAWQGFGSPVEKPQGSPM